MYHYADGNEPRGPVERESLRGKITPDTLVWRAGMADWLPASDVEDLREILADTAPVQPVAFAASTFPESGAARTGTPPIVGYASAHTLGTTPGLATASMVLGIVSIPAMCIWPFALVCAILAITFGVIARSQCRREHRSGAGMALAGIICGFIPLGIVLIIIAIMITAIVAASLGY